MNRAAIVLLALVLLALPVYSVQISLDSDDIARIGGTGLVEVKCPASGTPCRIDRVSWVMTMTAPYEVDKVKVRWKPAESALTYTVYVTIYDSSRSAIASGYMDQSGSTDYVVTEVNITTTTGDEYVNPKDIYYVEIVIVEKVVI